jgi:hypothetical protein
MSISSAAFGTLNKAISAYSDELYTRAKKLVGTELVGTDASINANGEDFIGQVRFYKPLGNYAVGATGGTSEDVTGAASAVVNVASQDEDYGKTSNISTEVQTYIKTVRTHGANEYMVSSLISGQEGLAKIARDFAETRAEDEDQALRACLSGVMNTELKTANDLAASSYAAAFAGNSVDGDPSKAFAYVAASSDTVGTGSSIEALVDNTQATPGKRVEHIIRAMGAWSDYAPSFVYMVISPEVYLDIKVANLVDDERVTDGNISFETILGGVIRVIVSRNFSAALASATNAALSGVTAMSTVKVSYMMLPSSVFMADVQVANPVAVDRNEGVGMGAGRTTAWYRWGYVMHARGYSFTGTQTAFASNAAYTGTVASPSWARKADILNLGILPIFHA